jgi:hypothetical protein
MEEASKVTDEVKTFPKLLEVDLVDEQRLAYGRELAQLDADIETLEGEKREATKSFRDSIREKKARARQVSRILREGKDEQEVPVQWNYKWSEGTKTLIRTDTGAVVERGTITDDERQMAFEMGETKAEAQLREMMLTEKPQRQIDVEE